LDLCIQVFRIRLKIIHSDVLFYQRSPVNVQKSLLKAITM
jgi:hypothetical protein